MCRDAVQRYTYHMARTIKSKGLSFKVPRAKTQPRGSTTALLGPHTGVSKHIGGGSWKNLHIHPASPPLTGNGKGGKQIMLTGVGPQTQRAQGPTLF